MEVLDRRSRTVDGRMLKRDLLRVNDAGRELVFRVETLLVLLHAVELVADVLVEPGLAHAMDRRTWVGHAKRRLGKVDVDVLSECSGYAHVTRRTHEGGIRSTAHTRTSGDFVSKSRLSLSGMTNLMSASVEIIVTSQPTIAASMSKESVI